MQTNSMSYGLRIAFDPCSALETMQVRRLKPDAKLIRPREKRHVTGIYHAVLIAYFSRASRISLNKLARMLACSVHMASLVSHFTDNPRGGEQQPPFCGRLHQLIDIFPSTSGGRQRRASRKRGECIFCVHASDMQYVLRLASLSLEAII